MGEKDDEEQLIALRRGKWSQPDLPHRGWVCVDEFDTFERYGRDHRITCEMCETMSVRFVHVMEHPNYGASLQCGCVCAGHMESNYTAAKKRDKSLRNRASRRDKFPNRVGWKISAKRTPYIKVDGYHLMVGSRRNGGFIVGITPPGGDKPIWGSKNYPTLQEAQIGCFDALEITKENYESRHH